MLRRPVSLLLVLAFFGLAPVSSASAGPVEDAPPASIRVCRSSGAVETVPFKEYVKTVLPVEFFSTWPTETLRAGAAAIKSYAWYYVRHPISDRCDLGDTTRHQVYAPEKQRRTARTDQAVEDTWRLRMFDLTRRDIAFAQYCSRGCATHARNAGEGRYLDQDQAFELGQAGHGHLEMLRHFYRNLPLELTDWTRGLALRSRADVVPMEAPPSPLVFDVSGVAAGDPRVQVAAFALCTIDGAPGPHLLEVAAVSQAADGRAVASFSGLQRLDECQEREAALHVQLLVNGHAAVTEAVAVWRTWTSATPRDVERLGESDGPVLSSVQVSQALFSSQQAPQASSTDMMGSLPSATEEEAEVVLAQAAVLARSDAFPDALGATALAGTEAPLLLHPSGEDKELNEAVADELRRILEPGATVHLVGGTRALSARVEEQVAELGFVTVRTSGDDRVATALALADRVQERTGGTGRVVLTRGFDNDASGWADAVSVGPWAARTSTPVLLTRPGVLDPRVEAWIEDPANDVREVIVVGGPGAVTTSVEAQLDGVAVVRVAGGRRDETALAVADELWGTRGAPQPAAAVAQNVFDEGGWTAAVVGAVPAARRDAAAVSTWAQVPPTTTGLWLDGRPTLPVLVVGGPSLVPAKVEQALRGA